MIMRFYPGTYSLSTAQTSKEMLEEMSVPPAAETETSSGEERILNGRPAQKKRLVRRRKEGHSDGRRKAHYRLYPFFWSRIWILFWNRLNREARENFVPIIRRETGAC